VKKGGKEHKEKVSKNDGKIRMFRLEIKRIR